MTTIGIIGTVLTVLGLLLKLFLKYYPEWRDKRNAKKDQEIIDEFGESLTTSDDIRTSELLDAEFRRVRGQKGHGTS